MTHNLRALNARVSFVAVLTVLALPGGVDAAVNIGQLTDPQHPAVEGPLDIVAAWIEQTGGQLTFAMRTRTIIPTTLPNPDDNMTYLWLVDTDEDPGTGQPHGQLGSEFNVRAVISGTYGGGFVDVCGEEPGGGLGEVTVSADVISITIWLSQLNVPADFNWRCSSFHIANGSWVSGNPETVIVGSSTLSYTPPARVTVTTPILELCPTGPATGQLEVEIRDTDGNVLPNAEHVVSYHSTSESVATVDANGLVTAVTIPEQHWQTPYIEVWADGVMADNAAVIRVNSVDLGVVHQEYPAEHVAFWLVPSLEGVDLDAITTTYQVVEATELAYQAQATGLGTVPTGGGTQYLVLDVADDPETSVCGASGNPIRLGWLWGQPAHNSCYIVNDPANRVPQWFVIWHEIGHNFTCACNSFNLFCMGPSQNHNFTYSEGLASLAAMWSWQSIIASPGGLGQTAIDDIQRQFAVASTPQVRQRLLEYQNAGADYDLIDPDILDGLLCELHDQHGMKVWFDLFSTFLPATDPLPLPLDTKEKQATWFVAAMSASTGEDLRDLFATAYGFPIDNTAWPEILAAVQSRIDARPWAPTAVEPPDGDLPPTPIVAGDRLLPVAPNPFNPRAEIRFALAAAGPVALVIHDLRGRSVATLLAGELTPAGEHAAVWNGRDQNGRAVAAGTYIVRLVTPSGSDVKKVTVAK